MHHFLQSMTLLGVVQRVDPDAHAFDLQCRSGDVFQVFVGRETAFRMLRNLDGLERDRVPPGPAAADDVAGKVARYVHPDMLLGVQGVLQMHGDAQRFDAHAVHLLHSKPGRYLFEDTHWWLTQIQRLADEWLDDLFGDRRRYDVGDFAEMYRTQLNILGQPTDDDVQECATLSRLIYGLSSVYLLTGRERYLDAARAAVRYQRETFRSLSHDGAYCFWHFGKRKTAQGARLIVASENADDRGTIPLYEQIYALAGLAQYYRITQEWEVLEDIRRTVAAFEDFYHDTEELGYGGTGGYFSHLDYATMRPDDPALGDNRLRKNWNSIGDHIPAYLVNLLIALDAGPDERDGFYRTCERMLLETSGLIVEKFPDADPDVAFVDERFHADWTPDHEWGWQRDRAVVGHNLKIAWNLMRVVNYCEARAGEHDRPGEAQVWRDRAARARAVATRLGDRMERSGIDPLRSGCFDAVERRPTNGMPIEFVWGATKDFWQQEQAIIAYLILHGCVPGDDNQARRTRYLGLARELMAFWNLFFLDHDNRGYFFRVTDNGQPVIQGEYGLKSAHSTCAYHVFELAYLAHLYIRSYVDVAAGANRIERETGSDQRHPAVDANFCLFFRPDQHARTRWINVQPDFVPPGRLQVAGIKVNGVPRKSFMPTKFEIEVGEGERGAQFIVEYRPTF